MNNGSGTARAPQKPDPGARPRIQSVDILRGLVMIVMALDHVRDYFHFDAQHFEPTDLSQTNALLFFTRWITHFCAPTFMFLAGTGAYLQSRRGKSRSEVSRFLLTRGLWLVVLEFTWVLCLGWKMNFKYTEVYLIVIWALGACMIVLAGLIYLSWRVLLVFSLAVIGLHNLTDGVRPEQFGLVNWLWKILHSPDAIQITSHTVAYTGYPLVPWFAVMAAGYCFGRILDLSSEQRRRILFRLGGAMTAGFVVLRWLSVYSDPRAWQKGPHAVLSFLDCTKYPPSLLYLLMTLGPAILILGLLEHARLEDWNPLIVFGRVPLFYYLLHVPLIHGLAILLGGLRYGRWDFLLDVPPAFGGPKQGFPPDYGYNLAIVYLIWIVCVVTLYPACRWFAALKQRNRSVVLSYF